MTDDLAYKIAPLPVAKRPGRVRGTPEERAARVQAHMERVHPMIDAIRREEAEIVARSRLFGNRSLDAGGEVD